MTPSQRYRERHREEILLRQRKYYKENSEAIRLGHLNTPEILRRAAEYLDRFRFTCAILSAMKHPHEESK